MSNPAEARNIKLGPSSAIAAPRLPNADVDIVYVEDEAEVRAGVVLALELVGYRVHAFSSVEEAKALRISLQSCVVVCDVRLPGQSGIDWMHELRRTLSDVPVILVTGHGDIAMAVQAMRDGAYDFIEKPVASEILIATVRRAVEKQRLSHEICQLRQQLGHRDRIEAMLIGRSPQIQKVRDTILNLATAAIDVLIYGETGTGKEVVAQCLHHFSGRPGNFVPMNCGGLPESLIESEIFGHEAGAFTGANRQRIGKIEHASNGTLFLDEIESMSMAVQVKLLRSLQDRKIERLGSNKFVTVDCRVVAASKENLLLLSNKKEFRSDLYYRIGVGIIDIPPLRDRREDILLLFSHFVADASLRYQKKSRLISDNVAAKLLAYAWPGNVRELKNVADRYVLGLNYDIEIDNIIGTTLTLSEQMKKIENSLVLKALSESNNNIKMAANILKIPTKTLYHKLNNINKML